MLALYRNIAASFGFRDAVVYNSEGILVAFAGLWAQQRAGDLSPAVVAGWLMVKHSVCDF
jgi:hypothetical protein